MFIYLFAKKCLYIMNLWRKLGKKEEKGKFDLVKRDKP